MTSAAKPLGKPHCTFTCWRGARSTAPTGSATLPDDAASESASAALTEGEVRKVDKAAQKVTSRHGPLASLDMPAMTLVFRVSDPAMLDALNVGDKIRFKAERVDGALTIMSIDRSQ